MRERNNKKTSVFRVLKRKRKVFVSIVPKYSRKELLPILQKKLLKDQLLI